MDVLVARRALLTKAQEPLLALVEQLSVGKRMAILAGGVTMLSGQLKAQSGMIEGLPICETRQGKTPVVDHLVFSSVMF
jgi:hypothetical protein